MLRRAKLWAPISEDVKPLPVRENVGRVLGYEEKTRLIALAKRRPEWQSMRLAMILSLNTTMRASEVRSLRWADIDFVDKAIIVRRSKTDAGERKIPLNDDAFAAVMELRDRSKRLFGDTLQSNWFLFPFGAAGNQRKGQEPNPLRPVGSWRRAWRSLTRSVVCLGCGELQKPADRCWACSADLSKLQSATAGFRFHDNRHQCITELSEGGASDATIMSIAGHLSRKMLEHYSHVRLAAKRSAVEAVGKKGAAAAVQSDATPAPAKRRGKKSSWCTVGEKSEGGSSAST